MFQWQAEPADSSGTESGFSLDPDVAAELVRFYDALYLRETVADAGLEEQFGCMKRRNATSRARAVGRAEPIVRRMLAQFAAKLKLDPDMGDAIRAVVEDDRRLEIITISLIQFIDNNGWEDYRD